MKTLTETEIDERVTAEADDDSAWDPPIRANRKNVFHLGLAKPAIKGTIKNGVALPLEPVKKTDEGRKVIITFVDEENKTASEGRSNGDISLDKLIDECRVDTGIEDLASQHDHYLYGLPKRY